MKKLVMTLSIVAFLIGGLSLNANAQINSDKTQNKEQNKAKIEKPQTGENYDQMLKDYESYINKYIAYYEKAVSKGSTSEKNEFMTYQKKALDLQGKLEKAKDKLNQGQMDLFLRLKAKFAEALRRK